VTKTYFENLVRALENGLEDVNNSKGTSKAGPSSRSAGSSKGRSGKVKCGSSKVRAADDHHHH
jgi:ariadne-1